MYKQNLQKVPSYADGEDTLGSVFQSCLKRAVVDENTKYLKVLMNRIVEARRMEENKFEYLLKQVNGAMANLEEYKRSVLDLKMASRKRWEKKLEACESGLEWLKGSEFQGDLFNRKQGFQEKFRKVILAPMGRIEELNLEFAWSQVTALKLPKKVSKTMRVVAKFVIGGPGKEPGQFQRPWGICADHFGRILVADRTNNRIQVFDDSGDLLFEFGKLGSKPGEFSCPSGVASDAEGRIIVADKDNHRIQIFTPHGAFYSTFGRRGAQLGEFNYPWDVAVNGRGEIAVSDSKNSRIQLFDRNGYFLRLFGHNGTGRANLKILSMPKGVDFRPDGCLLVSDFNNHEIILLDKDLHEVQRYGKEGSDDGMFLRPQGVACMDNHTFAVADCKNYRIQVLNFEGAVVESFGVKGTGNGDLDCPQGIAYHSNGNLMVVDFGNSRVLVF